MTFTEIQTEIADRLNLTSTAALTRIGRSINERYKELASSIGIKTIERTTATANTVVGNRSLAFTCEKIMSVYNTAFTPPMVLDEFTFDELRNQVQGTDPPQAYAIQLMGASTVTVFLSSTPATIFALTADVLVNLATLSAAAVPAFTEDYHNILVYGGMATELQKMEKYDKADIQEKKYEKRLAEYRLYIAVSAYLDIYQGKTMGNHIVNPMV